MFTIPSIQSIKLILFAVGAMALFAGGAWTAHKIDAGRYEALELSIAQAHEQALQSAIDEQKRADAISRQAADAEAAKQRKLAVRAQHNLLEVQKHVQADRLHCVTWGLVRVLDAAAYGVSAERMPAPGGKPDAACAPVDAVALARSVVANYYVALANIKQLNALIANVRAIHDDASK